MPDLVNRAARIREHAELRCRFADAIGRKKGVPFADALRDFTDLHRRATGHLPGRSLPADQAWAEFAKKLDGISDCEQRLHCVIAFLEVRKGEQNDHTHDPFWPFRYDYNEAGQSIHLHFGSMSFTADQDADVPGILSGRRLLEQRERLARMFAEAREKHRQARQVRGSSWLYNREAYRRLFPPSYTAKHEIRKGGFQGGGRWGQFYNRQGGVNPALRATFYENVARLDPENLEAAFPLQTWIVGAPIEEFHKEYGIG